MIIKVLTGCQTGCLDGCKNRYSLRLLKTLDKREKEASAIENYSQPEFSESPKKLFKSQSLRTRSTSMSQNLQDQSKVSESEEDLIKIHRYQKFEAEKDSKINFIYLVLVVLVCLLIYMVWCTNFLVCHFYYKILQFYPLYFEYS